MEVNSMLIGLLLLILILLLLVTAVTLYTCYKTVYSQNNKWNSYSNQVKPMQNVDIERDGKELHVMTNWMRAQQLMVEDYSAYRIGFGTYRQVAVQLLENILHNLYNIRVKLDCRDKPFQIDTELPIVCGTTTQGAQKDLLMRLNAAVKTNNTMHSTFVQLIQRILSADSVTSLHNAVVDAMKQAHVVVTQSGIDKELCGTVPSGHTGYFSASALNCSEFLLEWDRKSIQAQSLIEAVQTLLQILRKENRQPSYFEYIALQFAYFEMKRQNCTKELGQNARFLGTPGFRRDTQSYMSLTDPGDGHVMGTTKRSDWMRGAIIHVEHLERPNHDPRSKIESYRIPSILDFCKVRLHVGEIAPTTSFMGRRVKDSDDGDFERDFVKIVHLTSAACTAMFQNGAAECKIAMEGLRTSQAVRYMRALLAQTMRSHKQVLSAAWNLNQTILDDYDTEKTTTLNTRMAIARRAIEITCIGGFEKVTWDGASDTYPSQCIMYQLSEQEALTIIHEAHERGLITYVSSGFKFAQIELAIYAGVDGVGIGGAQVLRFMDKQTGMHGPYMEENIGQILAARDAAAASTRGRGVHLLARLDTMYFEGSISHEENTKRLVLLNALLAKNEAEITTCLNELAYIMQMSDDGEMPMIGTAKRILQCNGDPLLKSCCTNDTQWHSFLGRLKNHVLQNDDDAAYEEYISNVWSTLRAKYHAQVCQFIGRQSNALLKNKHFK